MWLIIDLFIYLFIYLFIITINNFFLGGGGRAGSMTIEYTYI